MPPPPDTLRFRGNLSAEPEDGPIIRANDLFVPGRLRLGHVELSSGEKLLVSGPNGVGKSALLDVMAGFVDAAGMWRRPGLGIGYLRQHPAAADLGQTAEELYRQALSPVRAEAVPLESLGLLPRRALRQQLGSLSIGQRRRLELAIVIADPPQLLLLDEPTNHLSPVLVDELEEAIDAAQGTIVVATHDRTLRRRWAHRELQLIAADRG